MKPILCVAILLASCVWADEATDRTAVEKTISMLSTAGPSSSLFTADFHDLAELGPFANSTGTVVISHEPWREATWTTSAPHFVVRTVRFITPDVALVDGLKDQSPILFVMKKIAADWRIASVRRIALTEPRP